MPANSDHHSAPEQSHARSLEQVNSELTAALAVLETQYREVETARSQIRAVLDAASEAMVLVSPERKIVTANRGFAELFGRTAEDFIGHQFSEFEEGLRRVFADAESFWMRVRGSASDSERVFTEVVQQVWPDQRDLKLYSTPVHMPDGAFVGRLYVLRDVTRERAMDRMKSEFVSMVSHELRTPLTSIKGYVDLLLDDDAVGPLQPEQREFLEVVKTNSDRLMALINDLLDISRIEAGKMELKREELDLGRLTYAVATLLRPQMALKEQQLAIDVQEGLPAVYGDPDRVVQILTNLLSNAHKYTPRQGEIAIRVIQESPEYVTIAVRDTGVGLTQEEQEQLFTRFFRGRNPLTQDSGGTGLGLVITRSLVEAHGGSMSVESVPGEGSTFSFTLATASRVGEPESAGAHLARGATAGKRILVVDDEPDIARLVARNLERAGYETLVAISAEEALRLARTERPDLVTLDVQPSDVDGYTTLEWLKSTSATRHIPILVLSVMEDSGKARQLGAADYLLKPVREKDLIEHVGRLLARQADAG